MDNKKSPKTRPVYCCEFCDYTSSNKKDYKKHLSTGKHTKNKMDNKKSPHHPTAYFCNCGKSYKYLSGLSKHKNKCTYKNVLSDTKMSLPRSDEIDYKELLIQSIEQLKKKDELMEQMINKIGTTNNSNNTNTNSNNTNNFNINLFLNEKCKDAINFSDFIDRIEVSHEDLENNAELGFVNGISKIIIVNDFMHTKNNVKNDSIFYQIQT